MALRANPRMRPPELQSISQLVRESAPAMAAATGFMLFTLVPYLYGYFNAPPDRVFMFVHTLNSGDLPTYLAQIERARNGEILIRNSYTPEAPNRGLFRPEFVMMGFLARLTGISNPAAYHAGRVVFGVLAAFGIYAISSLVFDSASLRRLALLVAFTSSGLGWIYKARYPGGLDVLSADVFQPEAIIFMSVYESPHMAFSYGTMALLVFFLARALYVLEGADAPTPQRRRDSLLSALAGGVCGFFLLLSHPFDLITAAAVCAGCVGIAVFVCGIPARRVLTPALIVALLCLPAPLYTYLSMKGDATLQAWARQNVLPSQRPIGYALCYGVLWVFAAMGVMRLGRMGNPAAWLLAFWMAVHWVAIYLPVNFQRRMVEGWHIPIALSAAAGIAWIDEVFRKRFRPWAANRNLRIFSLALLLIFMAGTNIYHVRRDFYFYRTRDYRAYLPRGIYEAMFYIRDNTDINDVIFADEILNNYLPAVSGCRVFGGHSIQGVVFDDTWRGLRGLADGMTPGGHRAEAEFLASRGVTHWLVLKRQWHPCPLQLIHLRPWAKPYLEKVLENDWASVWRVAPVRRPTAGDSSAGE